MNRAVVLSALTVAASAAMLIGLPAQAPVVPDPPALSYVTTAHQLGVVGYRDPFGAVSPDGTRLAYTEGRFIRVVPIGGGAPVTLAPGEGQIRHLAWKGNDEIVAADPTASGRWWSYRLGDPGRKPLWDRKAADDALQLTFTADGRAAAGLIVTKEGPELWRSADQGPAAHEAAGPRRVPGIPLEHRGRLHRQRAPLDSMRRRDHDTRSRS